MAIDPVLVHRIRALILDRVKDCHEWPGGNRDGWPLIRHNLALYEFLDLQLLPNEELSKARDLASREAQTPGEGLRSVWGTERLHGFDLFKDSTQVYRIAFGDPDHPRGIRPNGPGEGLLFYVDPGEKRVFMVTGTVPLPTRRGTTPAAVSRKRRELARLEPTLKRLLESVPDLPECYRLFLQGDDWPTLASSGLLLAVASVDSVPSDFVHWCHEEARRNLQHPRSSESEKESAEREAAHMAGFLDSSEVYRAWFNHPPHHGSPTPTVWIAPRSNRVRYYFNGWVVCGSENPRYIQVLQYGPRDPDGVETYDRLAASIRKEEQARHKKELLIKESRLGPLLEEIEGRTLLCSFCNRPLDNFRDVLLFRPTKISVRCRNCGSKMVRDLPGTPPGP